MIRSSRLCMVVRTCGLKLDISAVAIDPTSFTLHPPEVPISLFNYCIIPRIVPIGDKHVISSFEQFSDNIRLTSLTYCLWILLWPKQSHVIYSLFVAEYNICLSSIN